MSITHAMYKNPVSGSVGSGGTLKSHRNLALPPGRSTSSNWVIVVAPCCGQTRKTQKITRVKLIKALCSTLCILIMHDIHRHHSSCFWFPVHGSLTRWPLGDVEVQLHLYFKRILRIDIFRTSCKINLMREPHNHRGETGLTRSLAHPRWRTSEAMSKQGSVHAVAVWVGLLNGITILL